MTKKRHEARMYHFSAPGWDAMLTRGVSEAGGRPCIASWLAHFNAIRFGKA